MSCTLRPRLQAPSESGHGPYQLLLTGPALMSNTTAGPIPRFLVPSTWLELAESCKIGPPAQISFSHLSAFELASAWFARQKCRLKQVAFPERHGHLLRNVMITARENARCLHYEYGCGSAGWLRCHIAPRCDRTSTRRRRSPRRVGTSQQLRIRDFQSPAAR